MVAGEGCGEWIAGVVIRIVKDADGAKGGFILNQQDGFIGQVGLLVEDQEGQLVVVVVSVFRELGEVVVFPEGLKEGEEIVVFGYIELGYVAAAKAKVLIDVVGEVFEVVHGLFAGQHCDRSAVATDDMGVFGEIIFKIAGGVVAAGGDVRVTTGETIGECEVFGGGGLDREEVTEKVADEDLVAAGRPDQLVVSRDEDG